MPSIEIFEQNPAAQPSASVSRFPAALSNFCANRTPRPTPLSRPRCRSWSDSIIDLNGAEIRIDGMTYTGIGRLALLSILEAQARSVGIEARYEHRIASLDELDGADLIVGADGANSLVRQAHGTSARRSHISPTATPGTARRAASRRCATPSSKRRTAASTPITTLTPAT